MGLETCFSVSLGPSFEVGEKVNEMGERSKSSRSLTKPFPLPNPLLASLCLPIFLAVSTCLLPFSPTTEPAPRLFSYAQANHASVKFEKVLELKT